MAGDLTRAWHKGNRPVEKVAFLAHRAIPVVNGLKIGGLTTLPSLSTGLYQLISGTTEPNPLPPSYSENVTSHDSGTYICRLENGLGQSVEVQTSILPCCVLLPLSWNTNENPSTDKLSRVIN